jgi:excisionase family DNA binding protein
VCESISFGSRVARQGLSALFPDMGTTTNGSKAEREHANGREHEVLLLTMVDAARVLSVGRTTMYELVGAGEIEVVHIGRAARVPVASIEAFVERRRQQRATVRADNKCGPGQART